jgi:hypothetical protein
MLQTELFQLMSTVTPCGHRILDPYAPLYTLKPVAEHVWIADGPIIDFGYGGLKAPFTTRMTVARLSDGDLLIHSPIAFTQTLRSAVESLGPVRHVVAPNSLHYWWMADWKADYPLATFYAVPGLDKRAKRPVPIDVLLHSRHSPWPDDIELEMVSGSILSEAVIFHRRSKTLVLTDLIENFESGRIHSRIYRVILKLAGVVDPDGKAPIDMRLSFLGHRRALRAAVMRMIEWEPQRIILAHGKWYEGDCVAELRRAFRWVL